MIRVVHITTLPQTAASFLQGQLAWLGRQGFEVTLVSSPAQQLVEFARSEGIGWHALPMTRQITPLRDSESVRRLAGILRRLAPHIVHSHTPKAGMVGMLAARLAGVPVRVHQLHGLRFETARGSHRWLLKASERLTCQLAQRVICVSPSLRDAAIQEHIVSARRATVLRHGSVNGLDVDAYVGTDDLVQLGAATRRRLGIPPDALCLGFVGRLVRDKGLVELHSAWQTLRGRFPRLHLLLVGPFETHDAVPRAIRQSLEADDRVHLPGLDWNTRGYYAAMDVFALPTHREGLGHVLLEAAAMGLPVVSCRVTGCVDAVKDGCTGTLVPRRDVRELTEAVARYLTDAELRRRHGDAGRAWVRARFAPLPIWQSLRQEYESLLRASSARRQHAA
jgi:glycosyltransferase involved in cell wall biosynthesis